MLVGRERLAEGTDYVERGGRSETCELPRSSSRYFEGELNLVAEDPVNTERARKEAGVELQRTPGVPELHCIGVGGDRGLWLIDEDGDELSGSG